MFGICDIALSTFALHLRTGLRYQNHPDSKRELTTNTKAVSSRRQSVSSAQEMLWKCYSLRLSSVKLQTTLGRTQLGLRKEIFNEELTAWGF